MKDKLLNDDYIIEYIGETFGKDLWSRIKKVEYSGNHEGHIKSCLEFYRSKATAQEVINDLVEIENKYHHLISQRFFNDNMSYSDKEHILIKAVLKIFFHDYIKEYPDTKSICNGIVFALDHYRYLLEYKIDGEIIDLYIPCLKKVNEYFGKKYLVNLW